MLLNYGECSAWQEYTVFSAFLYKDVTLKQLLFEISTETIVLTQLLGYSSIPGVKISPVASVLLGPVRVLSTCWPFLCLHLRNVYYVHFITRLFDVRNVLSSLYILDSRPLSGVWLPSTSSHPVGYLNLLIVSFPVDKHFNLMQSHSSSLGFVICTLGNIFFKKSLPKLMSQSFFPLFSCASFQFLVLHKFFIYFELICVSGARKKGLILLFSTWI